MKTKEELNALKNEVEALNAKLAELNDEELAQVVGGLAPGRRYWYSRVDAGAAPDFRVSDFDSPRLSINWGTPLDE